MIGTGGETHNNDGALDGAAAAWLVSQFAGGTAAFPTPVARFGEVTCPTGSSPSVLPVSLGNAGAPAGASVTVRGYWDGGTTPAFTVTLAPGQGSTRLLNLPFNPWQPSLEVRAAVGGVETRLEERFVYPAC